MGNAFLKSTMIGYKGILVPVLGPNNPSFEYLEKRYNELNYTENNIELWKIKILNLEIC